MRKNRNCIEDAIDAIYRLHVGVVGRGEERHERPHKPLLLLVVLDSVAAGLATTGRVPWSVELKARFSRYFDVVRRKNDRCTPENPFLYLRQEKWWTPLQIAKGAVEPLKTTPTATDARNQTVFAKIEDPLARWMDTPMDRLQLREAILGRFFPDRRVELSGLFFESTACEIPNSSADPSGDSGRSQGRSAAFRRTILEVYDYQCAACGLRIRLPQIEDLTFVDAAHLIPFSHKQFGGNDHPTNGIALCKNHHWAMDRFLIAPSPEGMWIASRLLDPRRSRGEAELLGLVGQPVLPPHEPAFRPAGAGLKWRADHLVA